MSNHARGLWGYSGQSAGGELTIQATGMGGPSAGLVLADLAELGVRRAVRIGTCTGLAPGLELGRLLVVESARGAGDKAEPALPDPGLSSELARRLGDEAEPGAVVSLDTLHGAGSPAPAAGDAADMQTATVFERGRTLGVAVVAVLIVTETASGKWIDQEGEERAAKLAGAAAAGVLSA